MIESELFNHLKTHKVGNISIPLKDGEKIHLECVVIAQSPEKLEAHFLPDQLPAEALDLDGRCHLRFDVGGPTLSVITRIEKVENDRKLLLRAVETLNHQQRREYFRVDVQLPVKIQNISDKPFEFPSGDLFGDAEGINISGCGIMVVFNDPLPAETLIRLKINLPEPRPATVSCVGHVVRQTEKRRGGYQVALHFDEINQEERDKIIAFCLIEQRRQLRLKVQVLGPA